MTRKTTNPFRALAIVAAAGLAPMAAADDLTVVSTMLRPIIGDLGLVLPDGLDDAAWIVNAYLIAFVAVMPLAGRVSDVVGRRRTFLVAWSIFLVGTIMCLINLLMTWTRRPAGYEVPVHEAPALAGAEASSSLEG